MPVFAHPEFDGHERVLFAHDAETGLKAIIAVHSTRLGRAAGGCRMWPYAGEEEALADALRLSRGMTYKNAVAGLDLGGGKSVIIADPRTDKTPALMRAFGRAVDALGGLYTTAEDVGVSVEDMEIVRETTAHVAGLASGPHASGDPSPVTARGVFEGLRRALAVATGSDALGGRTVAVQGLGHVGRHLCALLHGAGARLVVADIDAARLADAARSFDARVVAPDEIVAVEADVFAPCALGGVLDDVTIPRLGARIVAGAANNQLARPEHAEMLHARGILYVPDFALNAGGIINVAREIERRTDAGWLEERLAAMVANIEAILREARTKNVSPNGVAEAFARRRLG
ncbi:Glu/Leu/Phe/Val dehydrogenase dimerization domain-containing protein [Salinarimonas chemoclinalis]|uniref:Glu/Leu/Phe/Val dehydrogenase dimerization domain-containing protein n=1 Tax=Salinarimonas chemoclinalis TaxID=3241599 RepID=UPI0035574E7B